MLALAGWLCATSASAQTVAESEESFFRDGESAVGDGSELAAEAARVRARLVQMLDEARDARDIIRPKRSATVSGTERLLPRP